MSLDVINVKTYGAVGNGGVDSAGQSTAAFRVALTVAENDGRQIAIPAGRYFINEPLVYETTGRDARGLTLFGEGILSTTLVNLLDDEPLLSLIGGHSDGSRQWGSRIADFSISPSTGDEAAAVVPHRGDPPEIHSGAIELRGQWHCDIERGMIYLPVKPLHRRPPHTSPRQPPTRPRRVPC